MRDFFAAMALQGLMANPARYKYIQGLVTRKEITMDEATKKNANKAYMIADAMVKKRRRLTTKEKKR